MLIDVWQGTRVGSLGNACHVAAGDLNVTPDASWRCSRRRATAADDEVEAAVAAEKALYTPNSATFFARHDRSLQRIVVRPILGNPALADAARAAAVVSRLLRDVSYYSQQLGKLERRADRGLELTEGNPLGHRASHVGGQVVGNLHVHADQIKHVCLQEE
jgi:hypothetical protein